MRLMIIGPQGVGKGTQSVLLSQALGVPHVSTGDLFRSHAAAQTELGRRAQDFMSAGELVPDEVTNAMVADRLSQPDTRAGFLLDGFPRTPEQAHWLGELLGPDRQLQAVIVLEAPQDELMQRLLLRGRDDDQPAIIQRRLELYWSITQPLLDHYEDLLIPIDGAGDVAAVQARILQALAAHRDPARPEPPDVRDTRSSTSVADPGRRAQPTGSPGSGARPASRHAPDAATKPEAAQSFLAPRTMWPRPGWTER